MEQQGKVSLLVEEGKATAEASERRQTFLQNERAFGFQVASFMQGRDDKFTLQKMSKADKEAMAGLSFENQKELARFKNKLE